MSRGRELSDHIDPPYKAIVGWYTGMVISGITLIAGLSYNPNE